jgi:hypothetical protein
MYRIVEGATDILRPFVAREALNMHLERAQKYFDEKTKAVSRLAEMGRLIAFYVPWYARQWMPGRLPAGSLFQHAKVRSQLLFVERASRRLARAVLYAMLLRRQALRDDQGRQNRIEAAGEDLLVIATTALYAEAQERTTGRREVWDLAEEVFRAAGSRVTRQIRELIVNQDSPITAVGIKALGGAYRALSKGVIRRTLEDYRAPAPPSLDSGKKQEHAAV